MDIMIVKEADGTLRQVPMLRFKIGVYDRQSYILIGADTDGMEFNTEKDVLTERLGRATQVDPMLQVDITARMFVSGWPIDQFPDPDVIMVTRQHSHFSNN